MAIERISCFSLSLLRLHFVCRLPSLSRSFLHVHTHSPFACRISPWHHITMHPDPAVPTVVTMVVEIPRKSTKKNEISTVTPFNPIIHDQHNGKFR